MKLTKKQETTIETVFEVLNSCIHLWKKGFDDRLITRIFYVAVINIHSGYSSPNAMSGEWETTEDHVFTPQFIARYLLDNANKYLNDFVLFRELFIWSSTVITVTKVENNLLKGQTKNKDDVFSITCLMNEKYKKVGIDKLYKESVGYVEGFPLEIWPGILEYEKQYLV